ncbi:hypothetical protein HDU98_005084 [Podochytrium sp. JEL0797]|nr:hypothetical protein HDU98_005084 [Podochytrium sp. JEL0797]
MSSRPPGGFRRPPPPSNSNTPPNQYQYQQQHQQQQQKPIFIPSQLSDRNCSFCPQEFDSEPLLNQHVKTQHVSCNFCLFNGTRDALNAHYDVKHPGKAPVLKTKVEDPAEIAAWIAERKKKYPTEATVEQKKLAKEQKLDSGMILQTRTSVKRNHSSRNTGDADADALLSDDEMDDDDEEEEGAIGGGADGSSSRPPPQKKKQFPCKYFASGKCKNGAACPFLHIKEAVVLKVDRPALGGGKRRNLRSMLLETQVRRQNNIILQCIRFLLRDGSLMGDGNRSGSGSGVVVRDAGDDAAAAALPPTSAAPAGEKDGGAEGGAPDVVVAGDEGMVDAEKSDAVSSEKCLVSGSGRVVEHVEMRQ